MSAINCLLIFAFLVAVTVVELLSTKCESVIVPIRELCQVQSVSVHYMKGSVTV